MNKIKNQIFISFCVLAISCCATPSYASYQRAEELVRQAVLKLGEADYVKIQENLTNVRRRAVDLITSKPDADLKNTRNLQQSNFYALQYLADSTSSDGRDFLLNGIKEEWIVTGEPGGVADFFIAQFGYRPDSIRANCAFVRGCFNGFIAESIRPNLGESPQWNAERIQEIDELKAALELIDGSIKESVDRLDQAIGFLGQVPERARTDRNFALQVGPLFYDWISGLPEFPRPLPLEDLLGKSQGLQDAR